MKFEILKHFDKLLPVNQLNWRIPVTRFTTEDYLL